MIKVVIIDDEESARFTLKNLLTLNFNNLQIVGQADSVSKGYEEIVNKKPDLVFLDIDIVGGSGFNILQKFNNINFKIIFITAFNNFAIKAIKFNAMDYIVKPINEYELISGVNRVIKEIENKFPNQELNNLINLETNSIDSISLKTSDFIQLTKIEDIIRCQSDNSYTTFYLKNKETVIVSKSIKYYDQLLTDFGFIRVHQSHLVNKKYILKYVKKEGGYIKLIDHTNIPVSLRKKEEVIKLFSKLSIL